MTLLKLLVVVLLLIPTTIAQTRDVPEGRFNVYWQEVRTGQLFGPEAVVAGTVEDAIIEFYSTRGRGLRWRSRFHITCIADRASMGCGSSSAVSRR
jgi:hypothetical protein